MKLWELRRVSEMLALAPNEAPKLIGVIVRAQAEADARELASRASRGEFGSVWLDDTLTICVEIEPLADGTASVVMTQWIGATSAWRQPEG